MTKADSLPRSIREERFLPEANGGRRLPRKLSAETRLEIYLQVITGEVIQADAAREWQVDVSTVIGIRRMVKDALLLIEDQPPADRPSPSLVMALGRASPARGSRARHRREEQVCVGTTNVGLNAIAELTKGALGHQIARPRALNVKDCRQRPPIVKMMRERDAQDREER